MLPMSRSGSTSCLPRSRQPRSSSPTGVESPESSDFACKPPSQIWTGLYWRHDDPDRLTTSCESSAPSSMTRSLDLETEQDQLFPGERKARPGIDASQRIPGKREVDLYVRTYTTLLQSSGAVPVSSLIPAHLTAASSLHAGAAEPDPDLSAFMYSAQRLPDCIVDVTEIVLGQSARGFRRAGYSGMEHWQVVSAPGRRRRWRYGGKSTLAATIASASDLDDLIPSIVAYQIEWNKMHAIVAGDPDLRALVARAAAGEVLGEEEIASTGERLRLQPADWQRLRSVWGTSLWPNLDLVAQSRKRYTVQMIGGSHLGNARATHQW